MTCGNPYLPLLEPEGRVDQVDQRWNKERLFMWSVMKKKDCLNLTVVSIPPCGALSEIYKGDISTTVKDRERDRGTMGNDTYYLN